MLNAEGQEEFSLVNQYDTRMYENDKLGFPDFVHRSDILDDDLGFLKDDTLTLTCEFTVEIDPDASTPQVKKQEPNMAEELRELWDTSLHSDCILSVAGQEFKAHKAILAARCPVFHSMFMNNTKENQTGRVDIKDMEADILEEMITYIYTGTSPNDHQMASKLIAAADMHCLDHLKLICEDALCSRLDVASAAENLILGDLYRARHLKQDALTFINFNAEAVMKTNGWMILTQDHPNLIVDLYSSLAEASEPPVKRQRLF
ncbi:speckle-type POZ protein A-like [Denticeps clupeoides]|uniref:speckle-type POZ protein A-like n=1 Tax=Denticeps clupeoides TaxID=299321 RepID=UPI0010A37779|nr:speckle-type POZ protein A-like [Denticeps clupeoides]